LGLVAAAIDNARPVMRLAMRVTHKLKTPSLDLSGYKKALAQKMRETVAEAAMVWLDTVLAEIPVWSGASRATFSKLAGEIGFSLDISPTAMDRTGIGEARGDGSVDTDDRTGAYTFTYSTRLPWLVWNEYHNANVTPDPTLFYRVWKEGPYMFQIKGANAFQRFADDVRLPRVAPYIKVRHVR
jgi:hypothetical protein